MLIFKNWELKDDGELLARQYDHLSRVLLVSGVPDGWDWQLLVRAGAPNYENFDAINLSPMEGGVGVTLTEQQLSIEGYYKVQLLGTLQSDGVTKKHTDILSVYVGKSLSGTANWPTVPSEFMQAEDRIRELNSHPPIPGENGFWLIWDTDEDAYLESDLPVSEGMSYATRKKAGIIKVGDGLLISEDGVLSVDTTNVAEQDNTKPMTSAGVYTLAGNIEVLLAAL